MKRLVFALLVTALASGCVVAPEFKPQTKEGAQCKLQCAENMQQCRASSYTCDRGYATCVQSCVELEAVAK